MKSKLYQPLAILMTASTMWMISPIMTNVYAQESGDNVEVIETNSVETVEWVISPSIASWTYGEKASTPSGSVSDGSSVIFTYSDEENGDYSSSQPTAAGDYFMKATVGDLEKIVTFTIEKANQQSPSLSIDGTSIIGIDDQMEYRSESSTDYTDLTTSTVLETGTYYVRYKEDINHYASDEVEIVIKSETTDNDGSTTTAEKNQDRIPQAQNGKIGMKMPKSTNHKFPQKMTGQSKGQANTQLLKSTQALLKSNSSTSSSSQKYTTINTATHNPKKVTVKDTSLSSCTKTISYGDGKIIIKINSDDDLSVSIDSLQKLIDGCLTDNQKLKVANGKTVTLRLTITKSTLTDDDVTLLNTTIDYLNRNSTTYTADSTIHVLMEKKWAGGSYTTIDENNRNFKLTISLLDHDDYQAIQIIDDTVEVVDDIDDSINTFTYSIGYSGYYTLIKMTELVETPKQSLSLPIYLVWIIPFAALILLIKSKKAQIKEWIDNF
ncbi:MAG: hypothetical protein J6P61_07680 [Erysipelotrichaceae bacterium]|nr:hypothetical protein [Erysipelotrichaceae bacterium]